MRSLFISFCPLIAASAFAAALPGVDMSFRRYPVQADGVYCQVFFDNRSLMVPTDAVSGKADNPTGDYVGYRLNP
jgi:hypothetical protein